MTLVDPDDLIEYMSGINMNSSQKNSAALTLEAIQAELEMYINRSLEPRFIREPVMTDAMGNAYLSQSPVSRIHLISVVSDDAYPQMDHTVEYSPGPFPALEYAKYSLVPANFGMELIISGGVFLGSPRTWYVIDYVGGGDDFIKPYLPAIKQGILRVASREFQKMHDDTVSLSSSAATPPVDNIPPMNRGWQPAELQKFDRIRRRVIV